MTDTTTERRSVWAQLRARGGRTEYWWVVAATFAAGLLLGLVPALSGASMGLWLILMFFQVRRLHDFGRTGWWALPANLIPGLVMIPLIGMGALDQALLVGVLTQIAFVTWIGLARGEAGDNRFGPPPGPFSWKRTLFLR